LLSSVERGPAPEPSADWRQRAARFGAALFVLAGLAVAGTVWLLPAGAHRLRLLVLSALAVALGPALAALPWRRWPRRTLVALPLLAQALMCVVVVVEPDATNHYLPMLVLCFLFGGMTQSPGISVLLTPLTVAAVAIGARGSATLLGNGIIVLVVGVVVAEVLALYTEREGRGRDQVSLLLEATRHLGLVDSVEEATAVMAELAAGLLGGGMSSVYVADPTDPDRFVNRLPGVGVGRVEVDIAREQSGIGVALRNGESLFVADAATSPIVNRRLVEATGTRSALYVPVPGRLGWVAAVAVGWTTPRRAPDAGARQLLEVLAVDAGRILERLLAMEALATEARTDPLTSVGNRRTWDGALALLVPGDAVVMVDLDHFKLVNDRLGHDEGDRALQALSACLLAAARATDTVTRYGGDEFAVLLRSAGTDGAREYLQRVAMLWEADGALASYSAGFAVHEPVDPPAATVRRADEALYRAKEVRRDPAPHFT